MNLFVKDTVVKYELNAKESFINNRQITKANSKFITTFENPVWDFCGTL